VKLVYLASHPIQYHAPLFRELAKKSQFEAWFAHRQTSAAQGDAGYGVAFDWDVDLFAGYRARFLHNVARDQTVSSFRGCDTPEVAACLEAERPDALIVGGWMLKAYWQALHAARRLGIASWVRTDSRWREDEGRWRRTAKRLVYALPLGVPVGFLAAGDAARAYLLDLGVRPERIAVVPHTVDVDRFAMKEGGALAARTELGLASEEEVVGFVGRLVPLKRIGDLLRALGSLPEPRPIGLVVGDGPESEALQDLARSLGVRCVFAGFRNQAELPKLYHAMDVLALPSAQETWGLVVNEALAAGCSAVVSEAAGSASAFAGFAPVVLTHAVADVAQLARQIRDALDARAEDQTLRQRRRAVDTFRPERVASLTLAACAARVL
jgi:glycosyltransferase involved in cell wall biosynthesis